MHTIIGAGAAEAIDAANIMKPMLTKRRNQVIGATTLDEYRKHVEKMRRLKAVPADNGRRAHQGRDDRYTERHKRWYEAHHRVKYPTGRGRP